MMIVPGFAALAPTSEAGLAGCLQDAREYPLFITEVDFDLVSGSANSIVADDGAVFVTAGDRIEATLTVVNRVDPACAHLPRESTHNVRARVTYPLAAYLYDVAMAGTCPNLSQAGAVCTAFRTSFIVEDGHPGEHRVRFVVGNQAGTFFDRLAGAERVIVVDARPELALDTLVWTYPDADDRHTAYGNDGDSIFDLHLHNAGTYPTWNPNDAHRDDEGQPFYAYRSSFDAPNDGDEAPDHRGQAPDRDYALSQTTASAPRCLEDRPTDAQTMGENEWWTSASGRSMVCSYVRGQPLAMPVNFSLVNTGTGTLAAVGEDHVHTGALDKDMALLHEGNEEGAAATFVERLFLDEHRLVRAGSFELKAFVHVGGMPGRSVDPDLTNNVAKRPHDILGVDLAVVQPSIAVGSASSVSGCGATPESACPAGATILLQAAHQNVGDPEVDGNQALRERPWTASVWMRGPGGAFDIATDETGEPVLVTLDRVSATTEGAQQLWAMPVRIPTAPGGGVHELQVRLDDPAADPRSPPPLEHGRIAEHDDRISCTVGNNVFCATLFFDAPPLGVLPRPEHISARPGGGFIEVTWQEPADTPDTPRVEAYHVYRGTTLCEGMVNIGIVDANHTLRLIDTDVVPGSIPCYGVVAWSPTARSPLDTFARAQVLPLPDVTTLELTMTKRTVRTDYTAPLVNPVAGADVHVVVGNIGDGPAEPVRAHVTLCTEAGLLARPTSCELVGWVDMGPLASGESAGSSMSLETLGRFGDHWLCASAAADPVYPELDRTNNSVCERVFFVVGGTGLGGW